MHEHGMIFQGWGVRAILAGRKHQTRRLLKPQPTVPDQYIAFCLWGNELAAADKRDLDAGVVDEWRIIARGDRIWVRETWQLVFPTRRGELTTDGRRARGPGRLVFAADRPTDEPPTWRSPIHLAKPDARLWLDVTDVRVQSLWDITESDAIAEGVECIDNPDFDPDDPCDDTEQCYRAGFADRWVSINGQDSWDANPWVIAYTFDPTTVAPQSIGKIIRRELWVHVP